MGVTCMASNVIGYYCCCRQEEYQGNLIFKSINTDLVLEGGNITEEDKKTFDKCQKLLNKSEEERVKIADKFKILLRNTGAAVLSKPTLERGIITYVIYFFEQIILSGKNKGKVFDKSDFSITNFFTFKFERPFVEINHQALDNIKNKYGFELSNSKELEDGRKSILDFLSSITITKSLIEEQYNSLKDILKDLTKNIYLINIIGDSLKGVKFIINYFSELTSSLISAQNQLANPIKLDLFFRIANQAADRGITDPREIALFYADGENCGDIRKWEENIVYKKLDIIKY